MAKKFLLLSDTCLGGPSTQIFDTEAERERTKNELSLDGCDSLIHWPRPGDPDHEYMDPHIEDDIPLMGEGCPKDGDAEYVLASCGWVTDEDYGCFGGNGGY